MHVGRGHPQLASIVITSIGLVARFSSQARGGWIWSCLQIPGGSCGFLRLESPALSDRVRRWFFVLRRAVFCPPVADVRGALI